MCLFSPQVSILLPNVATLYNQLYILKDTKEIVTVMSEVKTALPPNTHAHQWLTISVFFVYIHDDLKSSQRRFSRSADQGPAPVLEITSEKLPLDKHLFSFNFSVMKACTAWKFFYSCVSLWRICFSCFRKVELIWWAILFSQPLKLY